MERKKIINRYKRAEVYDIYNKRDCPFCFIMTKIDITNIVKYCKKHKHYYATIAWALMMATNDMFEMRIRYEDGEFYEYDLMHPEFMLPFENGIAGCLGCEMKKNYVEFIQEYDKQKSIFENLQENIYCQDNGTIWISCEPWMELSSIIPPFDKKIDFQRFIWDKIKKEKGHYTVNILIMFHHGYLDGQHVAQFLDKFKHYEAEFRKYN
ncbi:MAG: hypothetical protein K2M44_02265 [Clostridia bacterium]|nr:hypothetical protein [Clostridia bacterium]